MGVFATRSPFRPNGIGLSCVKIVKIEQTREFGPVITVSGADLLNGTPIYDIKPYIPHVDSKPEAEAGFSAENNQYRLEVKFPESELEKIPVEKREALKGILAEDPRPAYQEDSQRKYGLNFAGYEVHFSVKDKILYVSNIEQAPAEG